MTNVSPSLNDPHQTDIFLLIRLSVSCPASSAIKSVASGTHRESGVDNFHQGARSAGRHFHLFCSHEIFKQTPGYFCDIRVGVPELEVKKESAWNMTRRQFFFFLVRGVCCTPQKNQVNFSFGHLFPFSTPERNRIPLKVLCPD